jgi:hypothetical protein
MNQALLEAADLREHDPVTVCAFLTSWLDHARGRVRAKTHDGYQAQIRLYALPRLEGVLLTEFIPWCCRACTATCWPRACRRGPS